MIIIKKKNRFRLKIADVWFVDDVSNLKDNYDILYLLGYDKKIKGAKNIKQMSLLLKLDVDENVLFQNIRKNVRYEINRCSKENVGFEVYKSEDIANNKEILNDFERQYNQMYKEKNMDIKLSMHEIQSYIDNNAFILTVAKQDNLSLCYHAYVSDDKNTRLLYSCSTFRSDDKDMKNLIARANKYLHWQDIKMFKEKGIINYDFGGISSFEKPNGIDQFKMSFGGEQIEYYNIKLINSFKAKLYSFTRKILGR